MVRKKKEIDIAKLVSKQLGVSIKGGKGRIIDIRTAAIMKLRDNRKAILEMLRDGKLY